MRLLTCAALLAYAVVLMLNIGAVPGGSDTSGYFNEAHLLSHFRIHEPTRALPGLPAESAPPYLYVPLGFRPAPGMPGVLVPTYPPGLSLLIIPAAWTVGWRHAGDLILILHSLGGLVLLYVLGREFGLSTYWSLAGSALLAVSPLYLHMSLWAMSDIPAMTWALAAAVASWKSRSRASWALAAGLCAGIGFLVRPSNFLIAAPMLVLIGASPRRLLLAILGGIPCLAAWMAINHAAYGGYLQSGYGAIGEEFHRNLVAGTLRFCAIWMPIAVGPIVVLTPLVLLALAKRTRVALALLAWVVVYVAFYLPYRWTHEDWWFLRFLLPAVPAFILSGLIGLETMNATTLASPRGRPLAIILIVMFVCSAKFSVYQIERFHALSIGRGEEKYGRIGDWLKANVPEDAALIAMQYSGSDYYFSHYVVIRADELTPQISERVRSAARAAKRGVYAVTFPLERKYIATLPGKWTQIGSVDDVGIWSNDWNAPGS
ncbi:MAG TPA: hypothetical protein VFE25_12710 [Opitutaceae bacterium]|nr:hypothetical protein [Opitutaceae bacterium]